MNRNETAEMLKSLYAFEFTRKNDLNNQSNITITLLSISGATLIYISQGLLDKILNCKFEVVTLILLGISIALFLASIFYLYKFYLGHEYKYLPLPSSILKDLNDIKNYYDDPFFNNLSTAQKEENINNDDDELFINYYTNAVDANTVTNDEKSGYLYTTHVFIAFTLILIFFTYCFYSYSLFKYPKESITKVEITNKILKFETPTATNKISAAANKK